jgi:acyl dehydratase
LRENTRYCRQLPQWRQSTTIRAYSRGGKREAAVSEPGGQGGLSGTHALDEEQIIRFAREFDPQPFHTDPDAAVDTMFGGLAASGWHTMALTMRLLVESVPIAKGVIGSGGEIAWPRATRPGDVLHVVSEIVEIVPNRSRPDRAMVLMRSETRNQRDEVAQTFTAKLVVFRRTS